LKIGVHGRDFDVSEQKVTTADHFWTVGWGFNSPKPQALMAVIAVHELCT
jgi:hypothetical protein